MNGGVIGNVSAGVWLSDILSRLYTDVIGEMACPCMAATCGDGITTIAALGLLSLVCIHGPNAEACSKLPGI